ncbi:MAG: right-handed parallel beta-helix repeat-containing protein [Mycobacteriaceae bacterium]|nr:right-handed parallel beta-helix repeat-containing protein [Mycobacteriaceae bacterium]
MVVLVVICFVVAAGASRNLAHGAPPGDSTAALQARFDQLKPGETLNLEPGTYQHSGEIYIRVPGVQIDGNGATLQATNDPTSAVWVTADNVTVSNLNLTAPQGGPRQDSTDRSKLVVGANGVTLRDVTITGSSSVGVFIGGAKNFRLDRVTVRDTRADGIQITAGSSDGEINDSTTERTGDDGFAVLGYSEQKLGYHSEPCRNITINSPVVHGTTWSRGIVVAGGEDIHIHNISVSNTSLAGVFIAAVGDPFFMQSSNGVEVTGGTVTGANMTPGFPMGAVTVSSDYAGHGVANAVISDLTITDTAPTANGNVTLEATNGGFLNKVVLRNIHIQQRSDLPAVHAEAPGHSFALSGFTMNGNMIDVP